MRPHSLPNEEEEEKHVGYVFNVENHILYSRSKNPPLINKSFLKLDVSKGP